MLIAWGATGNERNDEGSVFFDDFFLEICCFMIFLFCLLFVCCCCLFVVVVVVVVNVVVVNVVVVNVVVVVVLLLLFVVVCCCLLLFFHKNSWTPLHFACMFNVSTCQLLCALDGIDQNAVDNSGQTALDCSVLLSKVGSVRALLEFNVDMSKARVTARTNVAIVQLLEEHHKRSV